MMNTSWTNRSGWRSIPEDTWQDKTWCAQVTPDCPDCGRLLKWSAYGGGDYERGWQCNNYTFCKGTNEENGKRRWFCSICFNDFCAECGKNWKKKNKAAEGDDEMEDGSWKEWIDNGSWKDSGWKDWHGCGWQDWKEHKGRTSYWTANGSQQSFPKQPPTPPAALLNHYNEGKQEQQQHSEQQHVQQKQKQQDFVSHEPSEISLEGLAQLEAAYALLPRDSYTPLVNVEPSVESKCFKGKVKHRAFLQPPTSGPIRASLISDAYDTEEQAKGDVISKLHAPPDMQVPEDEATAPDKLPLYSIEPEKAYGLVHEQDLADENIPLTPDLQVLVIETNGKDKDFGFLVTKPHDICEKRFHWEFQLPGDLEVRVEAGKLQLGEIAAARGDLIRRYHKSVLHAVNMADKDEDGDAEDRDDPSGLHPLKPLLLVRLKQVDAGEALELDLEAMERAISDEGPSQNDLQMWLSVFAREFQDLYHLGVAFELHSPVQPTPNPSRLKDVMDPECLALESRNFLALCALGRAYLGVMLATATYMQHAEDHAKQLEARMTRLLEPWKLAHLLGRTNVLAFASARDGGRTTASREQRIEAMADILFALIGAYFQEEGGGFHNIAKLWLWFTNPDEKEDGVEAEVSPDKMPARFFESVAHLFFSLPNSFQGRTATYHAFTEMLQDHPEGIRSGKQVLIVDFENQDDDTPFKVAFRRGDADDTYGRAIDLTYDHSARAWVPRPDDAWVPIEYDPSIGTYVAKILHSVEPIGEKKKLPNKVAKWLLGIPAFSLMKFNGHKSKSPRYIDLQEVIIEDEAALPFRDSGLACTELIVTYEARGVFHYRRTDDGTATEHQMDASSAERRPLKFSEREKTLYSPYMDEPLPQKVVSWVKDKACLARLVVPENGVSRGADGHDVNETVPDDSSITWTVGSVHWTCRLKMTRYGFVYELVDETRRIYPLIWTEQMKTWRVPDTAHRSATLTPAVALWLNRSSARLLSRAYNLLDHVEMRSHFPPSVKQLLVPKLIPKRFDILAASSTVKHAFQNQVLLLTAFQHGSNVGSTPMPSNHRLAFVGARLLEGLVIGCLLKFKDKASGIKTDFLAEWKANAEKNEADQAKVLWDMTRSTAPNSDFKTQLDVCCNHLACAVRCVKLKQHKYIQTPMNMDDSPLKEAIRKFERVVEQAERDDDPWARVVEHDAPRCLGDLFLASIAAVLLDSDWKTATVELEGIIETHVRECLSAQQAVAPMPGWPPTARSALKLASERLAPVLQEGVERGIWADPVKSMEADALNKLEDVHFFEYGFEDHVQIIGASSPRVGKLRCAYRICKRRYEEGDHCEGGTPAQSAGGNGIGDQSYCEVCDLWCNGPTQFQEHRIGKKHAKNAKKHWSEGGKNEPRW